MVSLRERRRFAWIAICAVLLNVLVPAVSQALAGHLGIAWLEICTKDGLKRIAVRYEGARPDLPPGAHAALAEHCPYCAPHGAHDMLAPPQALAVAVIGGSAERVAAPPVLAVQRDRIARGPARAPPSLA